MSDFFYYLTESTLILAVLYIFFFLVLRRKTQPEFNRFYLLFALVFAVAVPFLSVPITYMEGTGESSFWSPASRVWNFLPELVITGNSGTSVNPESAGGSLAGMLAALYFTGAVFSCALSLWKLQKLRKLTQKFSGSFQDRGSYKIAETNGQLPTLSFLGYIFWDNSVPLSESEKKQVLNHELAHVKQKHSMDLLFTEILTVIHWFNPFIHAYRHSLSQVHEHLADQYAVKTTGEAEKESYLRLMVKQTLRQANLPLSSSFFQHNTLNRIHMLQHKPTLTILKAALGACVIGFVFFVAACQDENLPSENLSSSSTTPNDSAKDYSMRVEKLNNDGPPLSGIEIRVRDEAIFIAGEDVLLISQFKDKETYNLTAEFATQIEGKKLSQEYILQKIKEIGNGKILTVETGLPHESYISRNSAKETSGGDRIFEVVEQMPVPTGGMENFYKMVGENLKYPEEAAANGIGGRVYVQFVVEKDGRVSEVKAIKGVGHGLDEAATEVIRISAWEPGRQKGEAVAVRMVMPILFRL